MLVWRGVKEKRPDTQGSASPNVRSWITLRVFLLPCFFSAATHIVKMVSPSEFQPNPVRAPPATDRRSFEVPYISSFRLPPCLQQEYVPPMRWCVSNNVIHVFFFLAFSKKTYFCEPAAVWRLLLRFTRTDQTIRHFTLFHIFHLFLLQFSCCYIKLFLNLFTAGVCSFAIHRCISSVRSVSMYFIIMSALLDPPSFDHHHQR